MATRKRKRKRCESQEEKEEKLRIPTKKRKTSKSTTNKCSKCGNNTKPQNLIFCFQCKECGGCKQCVDEAKKKQKAKTNKSLFQTRMARKDPKTAKFIASVLNNNTGINTESGLHCGTCGKYSCYNCKGVAVCKDCKYVYCFECTDFKPDKGGGKQCSSCQPWWKKNKSASEFCNGCGSQRRNAQFCDVCHNRYCAECPGFECVECGVFECEDCYGMDFCEKCDGCYCADCDHEC